MLSHTFLNAYRFIRKMHFMIECSSNQSTALPSILKHWVNVDIFFLIHGHPFPATWCILRSTIFELDDTNVILVNCRHWRYTDNTVWCIRLVVEWQIFCPSNWIINWQMQMTTLLMNGSIIWYCGLVYHIWHILYPMSPFVVSKTCETKIVTNII